MARRMLLGGWCSSLWPSSLQLRWCSVVACSATGQTHSPHGCTVVTCDLCHFLLSLSFTPSLKRVLSTNHSLCRLISLTDSMVC